MTESPLFPDDACVIGDNGHKRPYPLRPLAELINRFPKVQALFDRRGWNAAQGENAIKAYSDEAAVEAWFNSHAKSPHTERYYKRDVERLRLWALIEIHKGLTELSERDLNLYRMFLNEEDGPKPVDYWCGPNSSRQSKNWRPYRGPLSIPSQRQAFIVACNLMGYLNRKGYLRTDPTPEGGASDLTKKSLWRGPERVLTPQAWDYALEVLETLAERTALQKLRKARLRFFLLATYELGARVSEMAASPTNSLVYDNQKGWTWNVVGKGEKPGKVPVSEELVEALIRFRSVLGLPAALSVNDDTPLIPSLEKYWQTDPRQRDSESTHAELLPGRLYKIIKWFFKRVAQAAAKDESHQHLELVFRRASPHWLRHTRITDLIAGGATLPQVKDFARHSNISTTMLYNHEQEQALRQSIARVDAHRKQQRQALAQDASVKAPVALPHLDDGKESPT